MVKLLFKNRYIFALKRNSNMTGKYVLESENPLEEPGTKDSDIGVFFVHMVCCICAQSCLTATPWTVALQAPLFMGFSRQEYWSGLPFPSPEDLPNPGIKPKTPVSLALASSFFHWLSHLGSS